MNPLTAEWVAKAEIDFTTAEHLLRARKLRNFDAVAFFSQQCVEKYLKGLVQEIGKPVPKTHNLVFLLAELAEDAPLLQPMASELTILSSYAVAFRYPGNSATADEARNALRLCKQMRHLVRSKLGLPAEPKKPAKRGRTRKKKNE